MQGGTIITVNDFLDDHCEMEYTITEDEVTYSFQISLFDSTCIANNHTV